MRIVIAPDKFKGSLDATDVAAALARGILSVSPSAQVECVPVADGGEGTVEAAIGSGYRPRTITVSGPTGVPLSATFAISETTAVIEMAAASGLAVLPDGVLEPLRASSRGSGELIAAALDAGCTQVVFGIGGSACTDGGVGLLSALGARILDEAGEQLPDGGGALERATTVDLSGLDLRLRDAHITLASDVDNPLLGPRGAAAVFGPQKGASPDDVRVLEHGLERLVLALAAALGPAARSAASAHGAGAAGGLGYAALAVLDAERRPGIDVVLDLTRLGERVAGADLVITGEGSLDEQTLGGKTPVGVANLAAAAGVPTVAVCGRTTLSAEQLATVGFDATYPLTALESDVGVSMRDAARLLEVIGAAIAERIIRPLDALP